MGLICKITLSLALGILYLLIVLYLGLGPCMIPPSVIAVLLVLILFESV